MKKVLITTSEFNEIKSCSLNSPNLETGGFLFGYLIDNDNIAIIKVTGPGNNAEHGRVHFSPDFNAAQQILNKTRRKYNVFYIGEWHKHPRFISPSSGDISQIIEKINDDDNIGFFIMLITNDEIEVGAYYMDKEHKQLEDVELEIIEDDQVWKNIENRLLIKEKNNNELEIELNNLDEILPPLITYPWFKAPDGQKILTTEKAMIHKLISKFKDVKELKIKIFKNYLIFEIILHKENSSIILLTPPEYPINPPEIEVKVFGRIIDFDSKVIKGWNSTRRLWQILEEILRSNVFNIFGLNNLKSIMKRL